MYRLHCFAQSGNSFKVAFMLRALRQPWEAVFVDYMKGGVTRQQDWREHHNVMGEAPVLEDGALRLSQSGAILNYLADKHGAFGGRDAGERYEVLRWLFFDNHKFTSYFASYRFLKAFTTTPPDPAVMAWLKLRVEAVFAVADRHLANRQFLVGNGPTIADFSMSAYLFYPEAESGLPVAQLYPNLRAWTDRLRDVPGWGDPYEVLPGERIDPVR